MFPCSSMGTVAGILQIESAHMSEANFSSHSETLNGSLTWWTSSRDIRGFAPFRAFERRCLRSSLAHGLIAGQSPMELGISSSSLSSINVPVLDSRIKQSRIVAKSYWLVRDQAVRQVQTNGARDSYLYLLSKNYNLIRRSVLKYCRSSVSALLLCTNDTRRSLSTQPKSYSAPMPYQIIHSDHKN